MEKYWSQEEIDAYLKENTNIEDTTADLHNHTTGSDGTQSPLRMLLRGSNRGKNIVSISDHDSVRGYTQLKLQILEILEKLEELNSRDNVSEEEKSRVRLGAKRLLQILENVKILPAAELITSYNGYSIEVLGYGVDPDILGEKIKEIHEGLVPGAKLLLEGTDRIIKDNNLVFDRFVIDNRADFKRLFFHELCKHPENASIYESIPGDTEEEKAENFSKQYLENVDSPFYVDMNKTETRGVKQIRADMLNMIEKNRDSIRFDSDVIENSHAISNEFYAELIKHPENMHLLSKDVDNLKKFIYGELYNKESPFFIDMSPSRPSLKATIDAIHEAGGMAFLAHPGRYSKQFDVKKEIEQGTLFDGVDGVEVFYPTHDEEMRRYLLAKSRERGLKVSGGSDDHLAPKDGIEYKMGTVEVPDIPETAWIKEYIKTGKDYIQMALEQKQLIDRLKRLRDEKQTKSRQLAELAKEEEKGEQRKAHGEN